MVHMVHSRRPVVIADINIPFIDRLLGDRVELRRLAPSDIDASAVKDADAIVTRTRTRCNAALLDGSRVSLVATATIGTDHIDFGYCRSHGIEVASAPGCNAPAVAQYVWSSILRLTAGRAPRTVTAGIVGVGHVGSIVERWGRSLGYNILLCDPPRSEREGADAFVDLGEIARRCDIITFHTPHTKVGPCPTHHLAGKEFFGSLTRRPVIINSARGPITDTPALISAITDGKISHAVIDCWEGEPAIDPTLLSLATIATPHIAGYSLQGKTRASIAAARAVADHFSLTVARTLPFPPDAPQTVTAAEILDSYNPFDDTAALRSDPSTFEQQRNHYALRDEVGVTRG